MNPRFIRSCPDDLLRINKLKNKEKSQKVTKNVDECIVNNFNEYKDLSKKSLILSSETEASYISSEMFQSAISDINKKNRFAKLAETNNIIKVL
jgi:hypothetical protein